VTAAPITDQQLALRKASQAPPEISTHQRPFCILCAAKGDQLYTELVDWLFGVSGKWGIRRCSICNIAWLDPQPVPKDIPALYSRYLTHGVGESSTWLGRLQRAAAQCVLVGEGYPLERSKKVLPRLLAKLPGPKRYAKLSVLGLKPTNPGRLLDVGCGNGEFIARMRLLGWHVSGVDPDPTAVACGRSQGLEIFTGTIADVPEVAHYDVVALNHVIEHVVDPVNLLHECRKRLRPHGGRLIITTPNLDSLGHRWFKKHWRGLEVPRHFTIFSPHGLRDCVQQAGLSVLSMSTETRLGSMIYHQSSCARAGGLQIAQRKDSVLSTKFAAHLFRITESFLVWLGREVGEEIFCICDTTIRADVSQR
jgi:SAM-dependent methyltransferase